MTNTNGLSGPPTAMAGAAISADALHAGPPASAAGLMIIAEASPADGLAGSVAALTGGAGLAGLVAAPAGPPSPGSATPPAAPPAAQIAAAVAALPSAAAAGPGAPPRIVSVQLDPEELGRVRIRIEQSADGPARVDLTAERPETLQLLVRDQAALHHALDQVGLSPDARVVRFHLADLGITAPPPSTPPLPQGQQQAQAQNSGNFASGFGQNGQPANQDRQPPPGLAANAGFGREWTASVTSATPRTGSRGRVDITA